MSAARILVVTVLLVATAARGGEPCPLVAGSDQPLVVSLAVGDPQATLVAGVTLEVDHPEDKLGIEGEGIRVPKSTISNAPADAIASANDLGDRVRIVIARPGELPTNAPLLTMHFARCAGAPAPKPDDFSCKVVTAADPSSNKITDVGCRLRLP